VEGQVGGYIACDQSPFMANAISVILSANDLMTATRPNDGEAE
jgi:hypothetical protein